MIHPQDQIVRCRGCGAWQFHGRDCDFCGTHNEKQSGKGKQ